MKCWCFNQEQLEAALQSYTARIGPVPNASPKVLIAHFLISPEAREHKLILDGMWDRKDPPAHGPTQNDDHPQNEAGRGS